MTQLVQQPQKGHYIKAAMFAIEDEGSAKLFQNCVIMAWYDMHFPGTKFWLLLAVAVISCNYLAIYVIDTGLLSRKIASAAMTDNVPDELKNLRCPPEDEEHFRVSFSSQAGAAVRGWPSKHGFYELWPCFAVELDFLGLDHFQTVKRPQNATDEEELCRRLRQLGAKYWRSRQEYSMDFLTSENTEMTDLALFVGWPARGGVWVLKTTVHLSYRLGTGRIHVAKDMEERCQALETLGAVYYENPEDCPDLDLSEQGKTEHNDDCLDN